MLVGSPRSAKVWPMKRRPHRRLWATLLWSDTHNPYEDKRAFSLVEKVAADQDEIVIMGDFADCYAISDHDKDPNRSLLFDKEVRYVNKQLDRISALDKQVRYIEGNHEYRLKRHLAKNTPALYNMLRLENEYEIRRRGWAWIPYKHDTKVGKIHVTHDVDFAGSRAHTQSRTTYEGNVVIAHTHRIASEWVGNQKGSSHLGSMIGWLGDKKQVDYMKRAKAAQWHLGFGMIYTDSDSGNSFHVPIPIVGYKCVVGGKLYEV